MPSPTDQAWKYLLRKADEATRLAQVQVAQAKAAWDGNPAKFPEFSTGARTFIQVAGKPLAVATDFQYSVTAETEEIRTIDTSFPWDIAVGQVKISGTIRSVIHPDTSAEAEGLFHTMQSVVHQPYVELMVQDANGNAQFFARGMFTGIQGQFSKGSVSVRSVNFVGVAYQHWAYQEFKPYSEQNKLQKFTDSLKKTVGSALSPFGL